MAGYNGGVRVYSHLWRRRRAAAGIRRVVGGGGERRSVYKRSEEGVSYIIGGASRSHVARISHLAISCVAYRLG